MGDEAAVSEGFEAGFSELTTRYRSRLHAHCRRLLSSHEDAEDAVQETFLLAWRSRASRRQGTSTRAWLYRIATNVCFDALDRRRRRRRAMDAVEAAATTAALDPAPASEPAEGVAPGPEPGVELAAKETVEMAYLAAIQYLPPRQQSVLILRDVLGRSARETAALLDSSVASVNSAGQRARRTLRERLPAQRLEWALESDPSADQRELLTRYLEATERGDGEAVAAVLCEHEAYRLPICLCGEACRCERTEAALAA